MNENMIKVGIPHGDINGISYEIILKTFEDVRIFESCIPIVYGSSKVLAYHRKVMDLQPVNTNSINHAADATANRLNIINCIDEEIKVELSKSTPEAGQSAVSALERAVNDLKEGVIDVLLTSPLNIHNVPSGNFSGHTHCLESQFGKEGEALTLLVRDDFRLALATGQVALSEVPGLLTVDLIANKLEAFHQSLVRDFMVTTPRIAVLSLNPGSGTDDWMGKEEKEIILPGMKEAEKKGVYCFGPYAADAFFSSGFYSRFDGVLAMYHDQALVPFRTISGEEGVRFTTGLPVVRTAPDQGVSYDIAGQNKASETAFRNALYLAVDVFKNRITDQKIHANPLKKQYFEKGSDNEKLDLTKDED